MRLFILSIVVFLVSCQSLQRQPASLALAPIDLSGPYFLEKKKLVLHDGTKNNWISGKLKPIEFRLVESGDQKKLLDHVLLLLKNEEAGAIDLPKSAKRALTEMSLLLEHELTPSNRALVFHLAAAFNYNFVSPVKTQVWALELPLDALKRLSFQIMTRDVKPAEARASDTQTSFWNPRTEQEFQNIFIGFGRREIPKIEGICEYKKPKDSYGTRGGFSINCKDKEIKIKFGGETKSEPFNSRVVWALGYNVTPVDYTPGIQIKYDRKIITEYNSRKDLSIRIKSLAGFDYRKIQVQKELDPFTDAIKGARLRSGEWLSGAELRKKLVPRASGEIKNFKDQDIDLDFEKQLELLVTHEGNFEVEDDNIKSLGNWSWNDFDHPDRVELRAFSMVAGFLNIFDVRTDNNKLRLVKEKDGSSVIKHFISDVGSGLGNARSLVTYENSAFNEIPWHFLEHMQLQTSVGPAGKGRERTRQVIRMNRYRVIERNIAFEKAQPADMIWMAKRIAQLSEAQMTDAMIASGFTSGEIALVREKLVARQKNMLNILEIEDQYPVLKQRKINRKIEFIPSQNNCFRSSSAPAVEAPCRDRVLSGQLARD